MGALMESSGGRRVMPTIAGAVALNSPASSFSTRDTFCVFFRLRIMTEICFT